MSLTQAQKRAAWAPKCKHLHHAGLLDAYQARDDVMRFYGYEPRQGETWGCNCRNVTGGTEPSMHALFGDATFTTWTGVEIPIAIASDVNSRTNPYGKRLVTDRPREMVDAILAIRTVSGAPVWDWGGYFSGNKDAMHDEIACSPTDLASGIDWTSVRGHKQPKPKHDKGEHDEMPYLVRNEDNGLYFVIDGNTRRRVSTNADTIAKYGEDRREETVQEIKNLNIRDAGDVSSGYLTDCTTPLTDED